MTTYTWEQFEELFGVTIDGWPSANTVTTVSPKECDDNSHCLGSLTPNSRLKTTVHLELTINLRKTKMFEDTKEAYTKLYNKILLYINDIGKVTEDYMFFEHGGLNKKLHLHSSIIISICGVYSPIGLVQQLSREISRLTRRKYDEKYLYVKYKKYWSIPFTLQITADERVQNWKKYISKDAS